MSPESEKAVVGAKLKEAQQAAGKQAAASTSSPPQPQPQPNASEPNHQQPKTSRNSQTPDQSQSQPPAATSASSASAPIYRKQPVVVEDGHVSEEDSDDLVETPAVEEIPLQSHRPTSRAVPPTGMPPGMPPGMDSEQMQNMMQNPGMMRQAAEMMRNMDPKQLQSMANMAGAPGTPNRKALL